MKGRRSESHLDVDEGALHAALHLVLDRRLDLLRERLEQLVVQPRRRPPAAAHRHLQLRQVHMPFQFGHRQPAGAVGSQLEADVDVEAAQAGARLAFVLELGEALGLGVVPDEVVELGGHALRGDAHAGAGVQVQALRREGDRLHRQAVDRVAAPVLVAVDVRDGHLHHCALDVGAHHQLDVIHQLRVLAQHPLQVARPAQRLAALHQRRQPRLHLVQLRRRRPRAVGGGHQLRKLLDVQLAAAVLVDLAYQRVELFARDVVPKLMHHRRQLGLVDSARFVRVVLVEKIFKRFAARCHCTAVELLQPAQTAGAQRAECGTDETLQHSSSGLC